MNTFDRIILALDPLARSGWVTRIGQDATMSWVHGIDAIRLYYGVRRSYGVHTELSEYLSDVKRPP